MEKEKTIAIAKKIKKIVMRSVRQHKGGLDYAEIQQEIIKILENEEEKNS